MEWSTKCALITYISFEPGSCFCANRCSQIPTDFKKPCPEVNSLISPFNGHTLGITCSAIVMCSGKSVRPCAVLFSEEFQSMWNYGYSLHNFFVVSEDVETAPLGKWLWLLMSWICAAQKDLFSLSISYSLGACGVCWARVYALWIWIDCSGNNRLYFSAVNQPHSQKGWEGEMCARQIVRPTDILSPDGKMGIFSFSPALTDLLPNRLIKLTMTDSCEL